MNFPVDKFKNIRTPFYYYDQTLLQETLDTINKEAGKYEGYHVHYAVKANANDKILEQIRKSGLGCDCVSGGEVEACINAGFESDKIVFAGVGKADWEINLALDADIFCFNVESVPELDVINELAEAKNKVAQIAFRVNPNVDAHTHHYITTGLNENKFGINLEHLEDVIDRALSLKNVKLIGLHFHIGSQITEFHPFQALSERINELQDMLDKKGVELKVINVGGGLGIDYSHPDRNPIPDFKSYFETFDKYLKLKKGQELHFELGRSVVCQCGSLISKVLYVKEGSVKKFAIVDAGMTDLIRPALYEAHHNVENISNRGDLIETYDVVGPICESSDCFGKDEKLSETKRGDLLAFRSAGAYGQIMACQYNCRNLPKAVYSSEL